MSLSAKKQRNEEERMTVRIRMIMIRIIRRVYNNSNDLNGNKKKDKSNHSKTAPEHHASHLEEPTVLRPGASNIPRRFQSLSEPLKRLQSSAESTKSAQP